MDNRYYKLELAIWAADQILEDATLVDNSGTEWDCDNLLDAIKQGEIGREEFNEESDDVYWLVGCNGEIGFTKNNGINVEWIYKIKNN